MKSILRISRELYDELMDHLLPGSAFKEEAAFLFVRRKNSDDIMGFDVIESKNVLARDFSSECGDYLELADETRVELIKRAHDLGACLVELHSHIGPYPAAFSNADRIGLKETVPYMWWRLKKRPYLAIVVARSGFDALAWIENPTTPVPLNGITVDHRLLQPTNRSLEGWK